MPSSPELSRKLHQTLGPEAAADLMHWMSEQDAHRAELPHTLRADIAEVRQELRAALIGLRQDMTARFAELRDEMRAGFATAAEQRAHLEAHFERRFGDLIKWSFVFWCGAIGSLALLLQAL